MVASTEWRQIPGYSRYMVSSDGRVFRCERRGNWRPGFVTVAPRLVGGRIAYPAAALTADDGKYRTVFLHHLVAAAFHGPRPKGHVVRHLNGNPLDSRPSNLRYGTHKDNVRDAIAHGTQVRGSRQHLAKLDEAAVAEIKRRYVFGEALASHLASEFGITKTTMSDLIKGRTWSHVAPAGDLRLIAKKQPRPGYRGRTKTSQFYGVSWSSSSKRWVAGLRVNGKRKCLGEFKLEADAARAVAEFRAGLAEPTGDERTTITGRTERVWRAL